MRGKSVALRVTVDVGRADRLGFPDHVTEQPATAREIADLLAGCLVETGGDELHERLPVVPQDAEGGILRSHDLPRRVHNLLQDVIEVMTREDRDARRQQTLESLPDPGRFEVWSHASKCFMLVTGTIHV